MKPPEDLRRRLLDASLALIASEGLEAFSMREVARRAGVSHQAPYHHFSDREAILAAIVAEGFQGLHADTSAAAAGITDPIARLTAIGKSYLHFARSQPAHFKLMFRSEWVRAELHAEAKACAQNSYRVLEDAIADLRTHLGERCDPALLTMAWSLAHGVSTLLLEGKLQMAVGPEPDDQLAAAEAVLDGLERLLRRG